MALEWGWLVFGSHWLPLDALLRIAPGAMIVVALRFALTGSDWRLIALPLLLSFPLHVADLKRSAKLPGGR